MNMVSGNASQLRQLLPRSLKSYTYSAAAPKSPWRAPPALPEHSEQEESAKL
jgi:hypothetical protein